MSRVAYIDTAKMLAIFCVLMGHVVDADTMTKELLYAFHMPAFFLLSGMVLRPDKIRSVSDLWDNFRKRFRSLMVPYLLWGLIYSAFSFKNLIYILYGTRETLSKAGSLTSLWFLPVLFLALFWSDLLFLLTRSARKKQVFLAIAALAAAAGAVLPHWGKYGDPFGADISFSALAFLMMGVFVRPYFDRFKEKQKIISFAGMLCGLILLIIGVAGNHETIRYMLMANAVYGNQIFFYIGAIGGSVFILFLAQIFSKTAHKEFLLDIGKNTLGILMVHKPVVELLRSAASKAGIDYNQMWVVLLISIVSLLLSMILLHIIEEFAPVLLGRYKKNNSTV